MATKIETLTANVNAQARTIVVALEEHDRASATCADTIRAAMQYMVDAAATAGLERTESAVKAFGKLVRDAESFMDAVAVGGVESKTITEYAQGAMRAHFHGVEWTPRLKNDSAMALPWGKAGKGATAATPNGGKVTSTDRAELDKTAVKLLAQARALGLTGLAADLLDVLLEGLDGFKEPKAAPV